ncbi:MAG: hypothetical protein IJ304_00525 [Clostridia bacterium]|nr:hypothetical protein [Clostridia bacterium]
MRNFKSVLFLVFLLLYGIGVCIGSARQVLAPNQSGMYEYLENAMSGYDVTTTESVSSIFKDNMKLFLCLAVGGFFLVGPVLLGGVMLVKGYSTGFAITAVLRLFGIYGITFCIANLVSAVIVVPMLCWYSSNTVVNIREMRYDRREFLKRFFVLLAIIFLVVVVDSGVRGFLSAILMKFLPNG